MKKDNIRKKWIGKKIRQHRLKIDITQKKLAEMLNVKAASICGWEKGKSYPTISNLVLISKILKIPVTIDQTELTQIEKEESDVASKI